MITLFSPKASNSPLSFFTQPYPVVVAVEEEGDGILWHCLACEPVQRFRVGDSHLDQLRYDVSCSYEFRCTDPHAAGNTTDPLYPLILAPRFPLGILGRAEVVDEEC